MWGIPIIDSLIQGVEMLEEFEWGPGIPGDIENMNNDYDATSF